MNFAQQAHTGTGPSARIGVSLPTAATPLTLAVGGMIAVWLVAAAITIAVASFASGAADRSYDQVEAIRAGAGLQARPVDRSHDQIEALRGAVNLPAGSVDQSYERVEAGRGVLVLPPAPMDDSYDQVERIRGGGSGN
jgi:hypothetical protein